MTKHRLLIAAAATALAVGSGAAFAQNPGTSSGSGKSQSPAASQTGHGGSGAMGSSGAMTSHGGTTGSGSPGEPKGAASEHKGTANEHTLSGLSGARQNSAEEKSLHGKERMGQSAKPGGKSETTGQAPKESMPGSARKSEEMNRGKSDQLHKNVQEKEHLNKRGAASENHVRSTTGQGATQGGMMQREGGTMQREGGMNRSGTSTMTNGSSSTNESVNLSTEQRTRIKQVIVSKHRAPRVARVDFALNVGTAVPRNKVKLVTVPSRIVEIEPAWRGYEYFMVGDQIVIVNPNTRRIVAVIAA